MFDVVYEDGSPLISLVYGETVAIAPTEADICRNLGDSRPKGSVCSRARSTAKNVDEHISATTAVTAFLHRELLSFLST
jgi:hypothetical protein